MQQKSDVKFYIAFMTDICYNFSWRDDMKESREVELFGVNIFDYKWEDTKEIAKECDFPIYKVIIDGKEHEFATKETSNNVWCFYLPKE